MVSGMVVGGRVESGSMLAATAMLFRTTGGDMWGEIHQAFVVGR